MTQVLISFLNGLAIGFASVAIFFSINARRAERRAREAVNAIIPMAAWQAQVLAVVREQDPELFNRATEAVPMPKDPI